MESINIIWKGKMAFEAHVGDKTLMLDAPQDGEEPIGMRPKPLMLVALAGCTGMDVASLVKKMRIDAQSIEIEANAEKSENLPTVYTSFELNFKFVANEEYKDKFIKIVTNSQEKYCGVADMLRMVAPLKYNVYLNDELILSK